MLQLSPVCFSSQLLESSFWLVTDLGVAVASFRRADWWTICYLLCTRGFTLSSLIFSPIPGGMQNYSQHRRWASEYLSEDVCLNCSPEIEIQGILGPKQVSGSLEVQLRSVSKMPAPHCFLSWPIRSVLGVCASPCPVIQLPRCP